MDNTTNKLKDLGWMNGWSEVPEEVKRCRELGHFVEYKNIGRCLNQITCPECRYTYCVDSSD